MPKPIAGDNGTGMHCNIYLEEQQATLFWRQIWATSDEALWFYRWYTDAREIIECIYQPVHKQLQAPHPRL